MRAPTPSGRSIRSPTLIDRSVYLDPAIWLASFSFLGALVWARYLERGLL